MAQISWERITARHSFNGARLDHGDHIGRRDGKIVALLARQLDGRWMPFIRASWGGWSEHAPRWDIRLAKLAAEANTKEQRK